jgi:hypothetical protein
LSSIGANILLGGLPNGLEMSRPASSSNLHYTRFAAAGRVGSIEVLGSANPLPRRREVDSRGDGASWELETLNFLLDPLAAQWEASIGRVLL